VVKKLSQTNRQAPTRRQIDAYVVARNHKFESKIKDLEETVKARQVELEELREKKTTLEQETQLRVEAIQRLDNKVLFLETLKSKFENVVRSLSASQAELRSLETKANQIDIKIKQAESELETLSNKLFKKQQREDCDSLLTELRGQKNLLDSEKSALTNTIKNLRQLETDFKKQLNLRLKNVQSTKIIQNLESKIRVKEKIISEKKQLLKDLSEEYKKSLEKPLSIPKVTEFVVQHRQVEARNMRKVSGNLKRQLTSKQRKLDVIEKSILKQSYDDLFKEYEKRKTVLRKKESLVESSEATIRRWLEHKKARNKYFLGQFGFTKYDTALNANIEILKHNKNVKHYLPLYNFVAKHDELKKSLIHEQKIQSKLEKSLFDLNQKAKEVNKLKNEISILEKKISQKVAPSKRQPLPRMNIENWSDAELFAEKYMKWLGFADAKRTGAGADEGKDVDSRKAIAQVKDMGTGASRPMLQQLNGVAAAERKIPIFFARSYATTAKEWGEKHGIALFQFSLRGEVKALSKKARELLEGV
jgi:FtsZ-binding cell division protein ZapB